MRVYILVIVLSAMLVWSKGYSQGRKLKYVVVNIESLDTETFAEVTCELFDHTFKDSKRKVIFDQNNDTRTLDSLCRLFRFINYHDSFDVRGKITFQRKNNSESYCFDRFGYFYCNGKFYSNNHLLHFLAKKIFSDELSYLK